MSQNLIAADFKQHKSICYITDTKAYAKAMQDEMQVSTGVKYDIIKIELFTVCKQDGEQ